MALRCGIVGLPNVGKSTLFNALCGAGAAAAANYPFCTIDPNMGMVPVPDPRLEKLAKLAKSPTLTPTTIEFVDIAGLVAGASKGEGLGNQFLGHIREVDAIIHVVRCFEDENIAHVSGAIDPMHDIGIINAELLLKDIETLERRIERTSKAVKAGDKKAREELTFYERLMAHLTEEKPARSFEIGPERTIMMRDLYLLTRKPVLYAANVAETDLPDGNQYVKQVQELARWDKTEVEVFSAEFEAQLAEIDSQDRAEFLESAGLEQPGLIRLIRAAYRLLGLITFFTAGPKESRAWTIRKGTRAQAAAGVIHTDFERGFIRAETIKYEDYVRYGSEAGARDAGAMRSEGKDYIVSDGDVLLFRFNV